MNSIRLTSFFRWRSIHIAIRTARLPPRCGFPELSFADVVLNRHSDLVMWVCCHYPLVIICATGVENYEHVLLAHTDDLSFHVTKSRNFTNHQATGIWWLYLSLHSTNRFWGYSLATVTIFDGSDVHKGREVCNSVQNIFAPSFAGQSFFRVGSMLILSLLHVLIKSACDSAESNYNKLNLGLRTLEVSCWKREQWTPCSDCSIEQPKLWTFSNIINYHIPWTSGYRNHPKPRKHSHKKISWQTWKCKNIFHSSRICWQIGKHTTAYQ